MTEITKEASTAAVGALEREKRLEGITITTYRRRVRPSDVISYILLILFITFMFIPILLMISMSLRPTAMIYADFWGLPIPPYFKNYAITLFELLPPLGRTLTVYAVGIVGILFFASIAAFAFARMRFPGSEALFYLMVLVVMMIPGVVVLTPHFVLATRFGLKGKLWGLAVTYIMGGQAFAIFLISTFFRSQPEEIFESARVDGANDWQTLWSIAMPLARPILVTLAIMNFLGIFGDLIWPSLMLRAENKTLMVALLNYNPLVEGELARPRLGPITAAYVFSSIPPLILFIIGMRYYIAGLTSGAIKA